MALNPRYVQLRYYKTGVFHPDKVTSVERRHIGHILMMLVIHEGFVLTCEQNDEGEDVLVLSRPNAIPGGEEYRVRV